MASNAIDKRKAKEMKKAMHKLQLELADEITSVFEAAAQPLDIDEIVAHYPENARKASCDAKTLRQYVAIGLGYMIGEKMVQELPQESNGQWKLALI
jgi:hypothetical protein